MSAVVVAFLTATRDLVRRRADLELEVLTTCSSCGARGTRRVALRPADRWLWVIPPVRS